MNANLEIPFVKIIRKEKETKRGLHTYMSHRQQYSFFVTLENDMFSYSDPSGIRVLHCRI